VSRIPLLVWFLIPTVVLIGAGVWFFSKSDGMQQTNDSLELVAVSDPVEGTQEFTVVSRQHIASGTSGSGYNSNPPTSGPHWPGPAKNGTYDTEIPDEQVLHNMEHGYVWISYRPDVDPKAATSEATLKPGLTEDEVNKLKEIVKGDDWKVVLSPRAKDDAKIALVAWGRLLNMDNPDYDKIKQFIKTYRNRGPEQTPD